MNTKNIGISGLARAGKNLFSDIMVDEFKKQGLTAKTFALAFYLKKDCEEFIQNKLNLSVWTEKTEEKTVFRPMLVWYGDVMRKRTQGKYWTSMLEEDLLKSTADVNLITDIRYSIYEGDEVSWIKEHMQGKLIHISNYSMKGGQKIFIEPPNEHEMYNDPIVKKSADVRVEWENQPNNGYSSLFNNEHLRGKVVEAMNQL